MNLKKWTALHLALLVMLSFLVSCNGLGSGKKTSSATTTNTSTTTTAGTASADLTNNTSADDSGFLQDDQDTSFNDGYTGVYDKDKTENDSSDQSSNDSEEDNNSDSAAEYVSPDKKIVIDTKSIINNNYDGVGGNLIPFQLMTGNIEAGYNDAYYAMDAKRIIQMGCALVRIWVQVDWMEKEKGVYDFNTPEMKALCRYIETFQEAGTTVQLSLNWKVGKSIQSWFSIPGLTVPDNSAPADLEAFAHSCSAMLRYLWGRGYDNVKYFTFGNEPDYTDFECYGDQLEYYMKMVRMVDAQLKKDGIRDKVQLWAGETTAEGKVNWLPEMAREINSIVDAYSFHTYLTYSDDIADKVKSVRDAAPSGNARVYLTEYSEFNNIAGKTSPYSRGYAGLVINGANAGFCGLLNWVLHGVYSMSETKASSWTMSSTCDFWQSQLSYGEDRSDFYKNGTTNYPYYIFGLMSAYIDSGSRVVKTTVEGGKDVRAATFVSPDGDITVLVECNKADETRSLTFDFGKTQLRKAFTKHIYDSKTVIDQNAIIPRGVGTFSCVSSFKDMSVDKGYSVVVYTTKGSQAQVEMSEPRVKVSAGSTHKLSATILDGSGVIVWSVEAGGGSVSQDGLYTPAADAKAGDIIAVKAASKSNPKAYGISLICIV